LVILLDERKKIFEVFPAINKGDDRKVVEMNLRNQAEFQSYCQRENGSISINDIVVHHFNDLEDGHTYMMSGGFWTTVEYWLHQCVPNHQTQLGYYRCLLFCNCGAYGN
jgi:hypothetical protein